MESKVINEAPERTFALVLASGDEAMASLLRFANDHALTAAHFTAIGAFERATLGYFDWQAKDYVRIAVDEQVEVVSLIGDVALDAGKPKVHAHVVVARRDGRALGGHLLEGHVRPTLEVIVEQSPVHLARRHDAESGLALIDVRA